jgi:hypothetical protein
VFFLTSSYLCSWLGSRRSPLVYPGREQNKVIYFKGYCHLVGCGIQLNARQIHIFFKISNVQQRLLPHFVKFVNWTLNVKLFLLWFSSRYNTDVISSSQMGLQLLKNTEIIKQTDILLWKIWRKYGSVSYFFSCTIYKFQLEKKTTFTKKCRPYMVPTWKKLYLKTTISNNFVSL